MHTNLQAFGAIVLLALGFVNVALAAGPTVTVTATATRTATTVKTVTASPTPSRCGFVIVAYELLPDCESIEDFTDLEETEIQIPVPASDTFSSCFPVQQIAADSFSFVTVGTVPNYCALFFYSDSACTNQAGSAVTIGGEQDKCFNQNDVHAFKLYC